MHGQRNSKTLHGGRNKLLRNLSGFMICDFACIFFCDPPECVGQWEPSKDIKKTMSIYTVLNVSSIIRLRLIKLKITLIMITMIIDHLGRRRPRLNKTQDYRVTIPSCVTRSDRTASKLTADKAQRSLKRSNHAPVRLAPAQSLTSRRTASSTT